MLQWVIILSNFIHRALLGGGDHRLGGLHSISHGVIVAKLLMKQVIIHVVVDYDSHSDILQQL